MTPQLQQAIKLLQLSRMELVDLVHTEMIENPLLEEESERAQSPEDAQKVAEREAKLETPEPAENAEPEQSGQEAVDDIDWESYLENYSSPLPAAGGGGSMDELPGPEQTLFKNESLTDHLLWQLGVADCTPLEQRAAEIIIGNLDDMGLLRDTTLSELAESEGLDEDTVEEGLLIVQEFDPLGVGARDLSECLLIQARVMFPGDTVLREVLTHHLNDLERKDYAGIARALGVTKNDVMDAHRSLQTLEPRPGHGYADSEPTYITPDIYVVRRGEEWVAVLNDDGLPRLRVSDYYRKALRKGAKDATTKNDDAKNYVKERLQSAVWLIRSIEQRQRTIVKVTESIIRYQRDFFEHGIDHLKPLVLREIADDIGMHESTISRVTTNKYVHTPRGIFELKFFFNSSIKTDGGNDIAAESVKQRIKKIIECEDQRKPLSDQRLVEILLNDHGIDIARRTVAKYREMLGILSSSKRKQLL